MNVLTEGCNTPRMWLNEKVNQDRAHFSAVKRLERIASEYQLIQKTRNPVILFPRQYFAWYCLTKLGLGPTYVGLIFQQDHATQLHSKKTVESMLETNNIKFNILTEDIAEELRTTFGK